MGQWYHIAGVVDRDAGQMQLYIDGQQVASRSISSSDIFTHGSALLLGSTFESGYNRLSGRVDEVRIWDTARTQTEIQDNRDQVLTGAENGLQGYWQFEENNGLFYSITPCKFHNMRISPGD